MLHVMIWLWFLFVVAPAVQSASRLNEYIQHFEPLQYNSEEVHQDHLRAKRSATTNPFVYLSFHAHGRNFNLRLKRDTSTFSKNLVVDTTSGVLNDFDTGHIYEGSIWGEAGSHAFGSIRDGVFDGKIYTQKGSYYVERAHKYFPGHLNTGFHSVIYHERDIINPHADKCVGHGGCGITDDVLMWMRNITHSSVESHNAEEEVGLSRNESTSSVSNSSHIAHPEVTVYGLEGQSFLGNNHHRPKRTLLTKRVCSLHILTDILFWEHMHDLERDPTKTREEITSLIAQHVKAANFLYENTKFNHHNGMKFVVKRITIHDSSACNTHHKLMSNPVCSHNINMSYFLTINSQINHDDFCLAYIFTYRDFSGGRLGLAWLASSLGASGGICEKYKSYTKNVAGRQIQTKLSLNTGIITFSNYNTSVPPIVSQLTFSHEIGHNFGSPHDYPDDCKPGGSEGNYIMFAGATAGTRPNNHKFSKCSVNNISAVLDTVYNQANGKVLCFEDDSDAFCGNHIVEIGEECDCGFENEECNDQCCYPRMISLADRYANSTASQCSRRKSTQCSPSEGPCCNQYCGFEGSNKLCRLESDCSYTSYCNGNSAICPYSRPKPSKTECNENTRVCINGECVGSICIKYNMEECFLSKNDGLSPEKLCELACQERGRSNTCRSIQDHLGSNFTAIRLRPGSPCDNFHGYCDVFQKCQTVDELPRLSRASSPDPILQSQVARITRWVKMYIRYTIGYAA